VKGGGEAEGTVEVKENRDLLRHQYLEECKKVRSFTSSGRASTSSNQCGKLLKQEVSLKERNIPSRDKDEISLRIVRGRAVYSPEKIILGGTPL